MGVRRSRFRAFDERTGRLERAIDLINDGQNPQLRVKRSERDKYNPQSRPLRVGPDRLMVNSRLASKETPKGRAWIDVGYFASPGSTTGSNFERPGIPALCFAQSWGTYSYVSVIGGYGEGGFGVYGYGGTDPTETGGGF